MIGNYFPPCGPWLLHLDDDFRCCAEALSFGAVPPIYFAFVPFAFGVKSKKSRRRDHPAGVYGSCFLLPVAGLAFKFETLGAAFVVLEACTATPKQAPLCCLSLVTPSAPTPHCDASAVLPLHPSPRRARGPCHFPRETQWARKGGHHGAVATPPPAALSAGYGPCPPKLRRPNPNSSSALTRLHVSPLLLCRPRASTAP